MCCLVSCSICFCVCIVFWFSDRCNWWLCRLMQVLVILVVRFICILVSEVCVVLVVVVVVFIVWWWVLNRLIFQLVLKFMLQRLVLVGELLLELELLVSVFRLVGGRCVCLVRVEVLMLGVVLVCFSVSFVCDCCRWVCVMFRFGLVCRVCLMRLFSLLLFRFCYY